MPKCSVSSNASGVWRCPPFPELVALSRRQCAFTGEVGAVALAPVLYGLASDLADVPTMMMQVAAIGRVTMPLAWRLGPYLQAAAARGT